MAIYLNGEKVEKLPGWAHEKIRDRVSEVVNAYFMRHPEELESFIEGQKLLKKRKEAENNDTVYIGDSSAGGGKRC